MAIQNPLSVTDYQVAQLQALAASGIRQFSAGGKARGFSDAVADQIAQMEMREFLNLSATLLPFARQQDLDFLGEMFGVYRRSATVASSPSADQNFQFYVLSGTFGSINNGQDILVPANVQISTADGTGPVFLSDPVTLPASASSAYFSATALTLGTAGNGSQGIFTQHNFTGYAQAAFGSLLVTNNYGVVGGADAEEDDNFRYRINLELQSQSGVNDAAIRGKILELPGIQDVVFDRYAGLFYTYVYSIVPQPAASLLSNVQNVLNQTVAWPGIGVAVAPDLVGISLTTALTLASNVSATDQADILGSAVNAVQNYINNLGINNPLVINEISTQIFQADARIVDVGKPNQPLSQILIWRSRADGTRFSRYLLGDYQPAVGERILVETNPQLVSPIALSIQ